jgi:uncharacterized membrane protein (DUF485 family)
MDHGPSTSWGKDRASGYKTRLGLRMFAVYAVVYAAFVVVNAVRPEWMAARIGQLNLATVYGFGLIIFALILALIYNGLSGRAEAQYAAMFEDEIANVEDEE